MAYTIASRNKRKISLKQMRILALIDVAIGFLVHWAMVISCCSVGGIILLAVADTFGRLLFNASLMGTLEITEALLAITIFLALGRAVEQSEHIVVDIVTSRLGRHWKLAITGFGLFVMLLVFAILSWESILSAARALRVMEVTASYLPVPVPVWLAKMLSASGLCIATLETFRQLNRLILRRDVASGHPHSITAATVD